MPVSKRKTHSIECVFFFSTTDTWCLHGLLAVSSQQELANCRQNDKRNVAFDLCMLNMRDKGKDGAFIFFA